jgi:hypothetical protein
MTENELFERIINDGIATESEIDLVTDIAGYSIGTLNQIIYARTGYRDIEQYEESELDVEPDDFDDDAGFDPFMGEYTFDC